MHICVAFECLHNQAAHPSLDGMCRNAGHHTEVMNSRGPWHISRLTATYGPIYKVQLMDTLQIVLTDPETISRVMRKTGPGPYLPKPREMHQALEVGVSPAIQNILTSPDGPYWKAVRQGTAPCFSASNLRKAWTRAAAAAAACGN
jgi:cytochrome P450